jgi:CubicO group peptidase (beta-lactamase class C family)
MRKPSHKVTRVPALLLVLAGPPSVGEPPPPSRSVAIDSAALGFLVDSVIGAEMTRRRFPGAVFTFVENGRIIYSKGYGVADVATGRAVSPDSTLFRIGSISKIFTATAAM